MLIIARILPDERTGIFFFFLYTVYKTWLQGFELKLGTDVLRGIKSEERPHWMFPWLTVTRVKARMMLWRMTSDVPLTHCYQDGAEQSVAPVYNCFWRKGVTLAAAHNIKQIYCSQQKTVILPGSQWEFLSLRFSRERMFLTSRWALIWTVMLCVLRGHTGKQRAGRGFKTHIKLQML